MAADLSTGIECESRHEPAWLIEFIFLLSHAGSHDCEAVEEYALHQLSMDV